jgi:hypothetical protein
MSALESDVITLKSIIPRDPLVDGGFGAAVGAAAQQKSEKLS